MADSAIQSQPLEVDAVIVPGSLRNKIINGQFDIWQRTTSFPAPIVPVLGFVGFAADRWQWQADTDGGVLNGSGMTQQTFPVGQTDVPNNPTFYMRWEMTGITGSGGAAASNIVQRIESVSTLAGKTATLSFWMRGDIGGTIAFSLLQFPGGGGGSPIPFAISQTNFTVTAGTWTFHKLTLDVPSISGFVLGSNGNDALYLRFHNQIDAPIATNQGFPTPISYTGKLDLANIQFEEEDVPTPEFEDRPVALELRLCQRFYEIAHRNESTHGVSTANPQIDHMWMNFKVEKRDIPTIVFLPAEDPPTGSNLVPNTHFVSQIETNGFRFDWDTEPPVPIDVSVRTVDNTGLVLAPWTADAEL